jgi:hypothetical protein
VFDQVVDRLARSGGVDLIVVDSVAALVPRAEVEADVGTPTIGAQARLMSSSLRKLVSSADKMGCTVLFLNQLRHKVGDAGTAGQAGCGLWYAQQPQCTMLWLVGAPAPHGSFSVYVLPSIHSRHGLGAIHRLLIV